MADACLIHSGLNRNFLMLPLIDTKPEGIDAKSNNDPFWVS